MGELSFRNRPPPTPEALAVERRRARWLGALTLVVGAALLVRSWLPERVPELPVGVLVEVRGEVERPGWHSVEPATLAAAVEAAGGEAAGLPQTPVVSGDAVVVTEDGVHVAPSSDPLLVGLPVDINSAGAEVIASVPGIGVQVAEAIVAHRAAHGLFYALEDLEAVSGLGPSTVEGISGYVTLGDPGPRPASAPRFLNEADAAALAVVPGIGEALAARIVADRSSRGPFATVSELDRVRGVGPVLAARAADYFTVASEPPPAK